MMGENELHNRNGHVPPEEWDDKEDCRITKDVLDNQELDDDVLQMRESHANSGTTSLTPRFQPDQHINVHYVKPYYCGPQDGELTRISEKRHLMQWRGEHFKCRVGISFDNAIAGHDWTIGLAQACDDITLVNKFDRGGHYSWEFQPLKSGLHTMVNDSNGSQWPFYSHRQSMIDIKAGQVTKRQFTELKFSDYFYPTMHWGVESGGQIFPLTEVSRRQSFKVWLLAIERGDKNPKDGYYTRYSQFRPQLDKVYVLSSMQWRYNIDLKFDCSQPLGSRCIHIDDKQEERPSVLETIDDIPTSALVPPNCNACQSLIFYPADKSNPLILKKEPEDIIVPWRKWRETMTKGYTKLEGFEQPIPPPAQFAHYPKDPMLELAKIPYRIVDLSSLQQDAPEGSSRRPMSVLSTT
ncbi:hypothetical protein BOX15_Mlig024035g1 [Macrostomum lignano]|uniref:Uncharacterized protein n=1 Tax=Macrostomum lignano TaxID=282301 RepID=A0A267DYR9_9PLAT|nr:hypothetical protein BOX15_Mlig024035g3 [Macrostomum lignano]PAA67169.1 hypothetical protein BOX15_Mlig024035g2 [Macrostomum lignano]PAA68798.1 hypothetical protein BOX15_Mlig024035g1 [Macrostomum lignano]